MGIFTDTLAEARASKVVSVENVRGQFLEGLTDLLGEDTITELRTNYRFDISSVGARLPARRSSVIHASFTCIEPRSGRSYPYYLWQEASWITGEDVGLQWIIGGGYKYAKVTSMEDICEYVADCEKCRQEMAE